MNGGLCFLDLIPINDFSLILIEIASVFVRKFDLMKLNLHLEILVKRSQRKTIFRIHQFLWRLRLPYPQFSS